MKISVRNLRKDNDVYIKEWSYIKCRLHDVKKSEYWTADVIVKEANGKRYLFYINTNDGGKGLCIDGQQIENDKGFNLSGCTKAEAGATLIKYFEEFMR